MIAQQADLQRPRRVGVADGKGKVRHTGQHHSLVGQCFAQHHRLPILAQGHSPKELDVESGGRDDDVGLDFLARLEKDARFGEGLDLVGHHGRLARTEAFEQVTVGHRAQPLVPRVVWRVEVHVDGVPLRQVPAHEPHEKLSGQLRKALAKAPEPQSDPGVLVAGQRVGGLGRQYLLQEAGDGVGSRLVDDVRRRALQHGDVRHLIGHRRDERHCRGAAADHDDALAAVVQILRPMLRMHDPPLETFRAFEARAVALIVSIVAASAEQPAGPDRADIAADSVADPDRPKALTAQPVRRFHLLLVLDDRPQIELLNGFAKVLEDVPCVRQHFVLDPGLEVETEGVEVRVGSNAGIFEQIPCSANPLSSLENGKAFSGLFSAQIGGKADAGNSRPNDQDVQRFIERS